MRRDRARIAVYALAGFYLIYMAINMYQNLDGMKENRFLFIIFIILFTVIGMIMMGAGLWSAYTAAKERRDELLNQKTMTETEPEESLDLKQSKELEKEQKTEELNM